MRNNKMLNVKTIFGVKKFVCVNPLLGVQSGHILAIFFFNFI